MTGAPLEGLNLEAPGLGVAAHATVSVTVAAAGGIAGGVQAVLPLDG